MTKALASPRSVNGTTALPMPERFWSKVERGGEVECWPWTAYRNADGYGVFNASSRRPVRAHRMAYELLRGPLPEGVGIDHLCRNRACCNPAHMEPVPNRVNVLRGIGHTAINARKERCSRGHPLSGENLRLTLDGRRRCRACQALWAREQRRRLAAYEADTDAAR